MKNTPKKKQKVTTSNSQKTENQPANSSENPIKERKSVQHLLSLKIRPA
jgi:hypothetical protein